MMNKALVPMVLPVLLMSCGIDGEISPNGPNEPPATAEGEDSDLISIADISVGSNRVHVLQDREGDRFLVEQFDAGGSSLFRPEHNGRTWREVFSDVAPGQPIPEALLEIEDPFELPTEEGAGGHGAQGWQGDVKASVLALAGQWDVWFAQNYCRATSECVLNFEAGSQRGAYRPLYMRFNAVQVGWNVLVYKHPTRNPSTGDTINLPKTVPVSIRLDGKYLRTPSSNASYGQVWSFRAITSPSFLGRRPRKLHEMTVSVSRDFGVHASGQALY